MNPRQLPRILIWDRVWWVPVSLWSVGKLRNRRVPIPTLLHSWPLWRRSRTTAVYWTLRRSHWIIKLKTSVLFILWSNWCKWIKIRNFLSSNVRWLTSTTKGCCGLFLTKFSRQKLILILYFHVIWFKLFCPFNVKGRDILILEYGGIFEWTFQWCQPIRKFSFENMVSLTPPLEKTWWLSFLCQAFNTIIWDYFIRILRNWLVCLPVVWSIEESI